MTDASVSVCMVTWNHEEVVEGCLKSLQRQTLTPQEVVVVDNASSDRTRKVLGRYAGWCKVILNEENRGFCGGHNQALRKTRGSLILLVNPDIVLQEDYIESAVRSMATDQQAGALCGMLLLDEASDRDGRVDGTGLQVSRARRFSLRDHGALRRAVARPAGPVWGVDGSLPMYRRSLIDDISIGGQFFDELFFAHKEAFDVAWRAQLMGWTARYEPACVAVHRHRFQPGDLALRNRMTPEVKYHAVKNDLLLLLKNEDGVNLLRNVPWVLGRQLAILTYVAARERTSLKAYRFLVRHLSSVRAQRRLIMARRRIRPRAMYQRMRAASP